MPSEWYSDLGKFERMLAKSDIMVDNWKMQKKKEISINDFDVFDKISHKDISLENIDRTFDGKLDAEIMEVLKSDIKLSTTDICELVGDFSKSPHYSVEMVYDNLNKMFQCLKRTKYEHGLRLKLQYKALMRYTKIGDFYKAFSQEFIAGLLVETLDYCLSPDSISEELVDVILKKLKDISFYEGCMKNGCNCLASTDFDDGWTKQQIYNVFVDFITGANVSLKDIVDYEQWNSEKTIKAVYGGALNVLKNLVTNYYGKKLKKTFKSKTFNYVFETIMQCSGDSINKLIEKISQNQK